MIVLDKLWVPLEMFKREIADKEDRMKICNSGSVNIPVKIALLLSWGIVLSGCGGSSRAVEPLFENKNLYVADLDRPESKTTILGSTVFDSVRTIILDTIPEAMIGQISKMQVVGNTILVLDDSQSKGLFLFDGGGIFLRQIGRRGSGPGEYLEIADFTCDPQRGEVYLLDDQRQRISRYDIVTGKFLSSVDIDRENGVRSHHIQYVDGGMFADAYFVAPSDENYLLRQIDLSDGKQTAAFLNVKEYNKGWSDIQMIDGQVFYATDAKSARFTHRFMDEVILLDGQRVMPYLKLRSERLMNASDLEEVDTKQDPLSVMMQFWSKNKIHALGNYREHDGQIFFEYRQGGSRLQSVLYDTRTGETKFFYPKDDLLYRNGKSSGYAPSFGCATSEGVFYYVDTNVLAELKKNANKGVLEPALDQLERLKELDDNSNPVVFFYPYKSPG